MNKLVHRLAPLAGLIAACLALGSPTAVLAEEPVNTHQIVLKAVNLPRANTPIKWSATRFAPATGKPAT
ncbi:hypothetical protein [Methylogaea oryzae]|uniref:hypothetical protein n=1 Tax=Methylogaea oryzae TaxID=1295382 RepID=UPI0020D19139|nr:hypothetical protein [Methylogaea oryzae]